jgi:GxxExxY protein
VPNRNEGTPRSARPELVEKDLSYVIVGCFYWVYNTLGFGFLESVYARALEVALRLKGLKVEREVPVTILFEGVEVGKHRMDMLVEDRIIIEIKSTEKVTDGLFLHFGPQATYHRILRKRNEAERPWSHSANSDDSDE